ncbi:LacI family DNA-binding transcriptional regulator [Clostridium sp. OS1-26]|uniref:LacI family DNA-binding transcriptional regulator n=1 Tax=Clostridium sp. OS1-26 TaxID=3070681 RepID=UPI0027DFEE36|nr:LacI family DNA-binding transcriptional regulator [Clostridium sp. OS1-26]WML33788.1 LacI family DNA-binding transcriptional regulator [Clostridium sp. OS1-26]
MSATINDIAGKAGVSLTTVSRVLNNSGYVKKETKIRVLKAIEELNYTPSAIARSLSKSKTNTIGVLIPEINNQFYGEVIKGISQVADECDLNIILCNTDENIQKELKALKLLKEQRIRGIIIAPTSVEDELNSEYLKTIEQLGIPVVLLDGHVKYSDFSGVFVDNIKGAFDSTEALIKAGHKKIAIITGRMNSDAAQNRLIGYKKALNVNNIDIDDRYILFGDYGQESAYICTKKIIEMEDRPTAIFVSSNKMTVGCVKALRSHKLKIPEDIAIVGFDKVDVLNSLGMNISFVDGPTTELGIASMKILVENLKNKQGAEIKNITLMPKLVLKGSEKFIEK